MATLDSSTMSIHPRKALVIGNDSYTKNSLSSCVNDANDLAAVLQTLGFAVTLGINCSHQQTSSLIRTFGRNIENQDFLLFFFSGHGVQHKQRNYLLPVEADNEIMEEDDIETTSIDAQNTLERFASKTSYITIFILDCGRPYVLPSQRRARGLLNTGLGLHPMVPPGGTLLQFACAPGTLAIDGDTRERNGLYTKHLLRHIATPNKDLEKMLNLVSAGVYMESQGNQIPHRVSTIMIGDPIYLVLAV